ncbi:MAG: FAD-dependent oxidoreductase [Candidatus Pacebacteria bacterium]|nr:FAD-dependent oxidoreductase [Candidatus Paceibacterota bacterium]
MTAHHEYETIIIGGGISGLSCARRLHDAGRDFLLISKDLGGRMLTSKTFDTDYGAAYMTEDYVNVMPYVEKQKKLRLRDFNVFDGSGYSSIFSFRNIHFLPQFLKLLFYTRQLRHHIQSYRKKAPHQSVKECFEADPWLIKYWRMPASEFIKKHRLQKLDEYIGNPATASTAFIDSSKVNTVMYLGMFLWIISDSWTINFRHTLKRLTEGYKESILLATVHHLKRKIDSTFSVQTSHGSFSADNVVIAAPQSQLDGVYDLPKQNAQQPAYTFHVVGRRREEFQNKNAIIFRPKHHDVYMLWKQGDGGDIVYSKHADPDFKQYYEIHHVVHRIHWHPGMIIPGNDLVPQTLEDNLYLASDYNLSLLEDSFLTGLYAANQIIATPK